MTDRAGWKKKWSAAAGGAALLVGGVSLVDATAAYASSPSGSSLRITPTGTAVTATATLGFTTTAATNASTPTTTITIGTRDTSGTASAANAEGLPEAASSYTVSVTAGGSTTTDTVSSVSPSSATPGTYSYGQETLTLGDPIPAGAAVTVTISGVANPTSPSSVYLSDSTSGDTTANDSDVVSIGSAPAGTPAVRSVNPSALPSNDSSVPFTITGTGFAQSGTYNVPTGENIGPNGFPDAPAVCFVPAGTTPPPASAVQAGGTCPTGTTTAFVYSVSATQIKAQTPLLPNTSANATYDVVLYNYDPATGNYVGPSATSAADQVVEVPSLNFVPESGVRIADSRVGMNMPSGPVPPGSPVGIPLSDFADSPTQPDNLPGALDSVPSVTALAMNVTAVAPAGPGNLQLIAENGSCPAAPASPPAPAQTHPATVNFQPPEDTSNYTIVPIIGDNVLCVYDSGAAVNVVMDLTGYTTQSTGGLANAGFSGDQQRLLDTRSGYSAVAGAGLLGPLPGRTVYPVQLPAALDNTVVALNVAAVDPTSVGNLRVFPQPAGGPPAPASVPTTAVVNYIPGTDASSFYVVAVPADGKLDLYSDSAGTVGVVLDEYGTLVSRNVHAVSAPYRVFDSRPNNIAAGATAVVGVSPSGGGSAFVPAGAVAAIGSLSDIDPNAVGNIRTHPDGSPVPAATAMANFPGRTRENLVVSSLDPGDGAFDVYSDGAETNSTFDVTAYVGASSTPPLIG